MHFKQKFSVPLKIGNLIYNMCILAHYSACLFILIAKAEQKTENWMYIYNISEKAWQVQYINSLYCMFITMITVGYGDIVPVSTNEKLFVIIIAIISSIVVGYSITTVG